MTDTNTPAHDQPEVAAAPPQIPPTVVGDATKPAPAGVTRDPVLSPAKPQTVSASNPTASKPATPTPATTEPTKSRSLVWLACVAFVLLAGGEAYLYGTRSHSLDAAQIADLQTDLKAAQQRLATLEQRPVPDATRIASLENVVKALAAKPAPNTSALEQRLATLESRPAPVMPDVKGAVADASAELNAKIASLDTKVQDDLARATRLRTAAAALEAGKPIGDLPGATAALQRYATAAPPTEPTLRQSFQTFATVAEKASEPAGEGKDFSQRMWARAQQLVTVRQGDKVLVGAPAAVTLAAARAKLDAGDLPGAVVALVSLDPAASAAMAPWKRDAQALLDARAALAAMATKS